jgi:hypothetical protein
MEKQLCQQLFSCWHKPSYLKNRVVKIKPTEKPTKNIVGSIQNKAG